MIRIYRIFTALTLCVVMAACAPTQEGAVNELEILADSYAENRNFVGTVLVARGDQIMLEKSYGQADLEWHMPNGPDTKYRIGSLSKPFVATLIMKLVEEDLLSLDDTIGQHLPDLYADTAVADVTIEELLSHTSGMMDFTGDLNDPWYKTAARLQVDPKVRLKEWIKLEFASERGKFRYNNSGFIHLGLIVESVTQRPFEDVLKEKILAPSGMKSTGMYSTKLVLERLAQAYVKSPTGEMEPAPFLDPSTFFTAAGLYSTPRDILAFDRALYTGEILSDPSQTLMHTAKTNVPYGLGWGVESWTLSDGTVLPGNSHTGSIPGFQSFYLRSETYQDFVIVLNNTNNGSATYNLGQELMKVLNGETIKKRLEDLLVPISKKDGAAAMIATLEGLGDKKADYDLREQTMNALGYKFLGLDKMEEALAMFEWNVEEHPESANPRDSLGEAYRAAGRIEDAIASYEAALQRDPNMPSATTALEEMRANP